MRSLKGFYTEKMENEEKQTEKPVGEMHKRREMMADGKRRIIFYTFDREEKNPADGVNKNV